jgi:hypothetical protein
MELLEPIFMAVNVREVTFLEELLEQESIEYSVRPEAFVHHRAADGVCLEGLLFEVPAGQAEECRQLIAARGLGRGVIPAKTDEEEG